MHNVRNGRSRAVHYTHGIHPVTLCKVTITERFNVTEKDVTCTKCKARAKGGTKHHITGANDSTYDLASDIGGDLPDGAFWSLYEELGG